MIQDLPLSELSFWVYLIGFLFATIGGFAGALRARRISDPDTRRGLSALLLFSGGWAAAHVGLLLSSDPLVADLLYIAGLIVGFATVGAWLYFCSAYTGRDLHQNPTIRWLALFVFLAISLLKVTNPLHELYHTVGMVEDPFPHLGVQHNLVYWIVMGVAYALSTVGAFMLLELFTNIRRHLGPVLLVFALIAVPPVLNVIGFAEPTLLDVTHEPIGVSIFALGVLLVYVTDFQSIQLAGGQDRPTIVLDAQEQIREVNAAALQLFGELSRPEVTGRPLSEVLPRVDNARHRDRPVFELGENESPTYYRVRENRFGTGQARLGQLIFLTDITERERRRRELEKSNATMEAILYDLPSGVWAEDTGCDVFMANARLSELMGWSRSADELSNCSAEELIGAVAERMSDPVAFRERVRALRKHGRSMLGEEWTLADGRMVELDFVPYEVPEGRAALWVVRDVTARKRREERLRAAKQEAEQASRMKSALLANVTHELRTPLASIIGFAETIGEEAEAGRAAMTAEFAQLIQESGQRLTETLDGILNLAQLEAGEMQVTPRPMDPTELAQEVASEFEAEAKEANIDLRVAANGDGESRASRSAQADPEGLEVALRNLLSNAIEYTEEGGRVWVRSRIEDGQAVVEVEDTGKGMDPSRVDELIKPFRQGSEGLRREHSGTGLGLAVTHQVIDRMGGALDIDSEQGEGTRVAVRLPLNSRELEPAGSVQNETGSTNEAQ